MQQITNQKFESLREQLTSSYKQSQILSTQRHQCQLYQSSIIRGEDSCLEQSKLEQEQEQDQEQGTLPSSIRSMKKKKQQARVMASQYNQKEILQSTSKKSIIPKILIIQRNYRRHLNMKSFHKKLKQLRSRKFVVDEFHQIEKNYNEDLNIIVGRLIPDIKRDQILTQDELLSLFLNVEQIQQLNCKFYITIQQILQKYKHFLIISQQFKIYIPFFKIYYDYCSRFQLENINKLRNSKAEFNSYIQNIEACGILKGLTFESFLVKPVQQLPRYVLMIEKLVKYTELNHPDYNGLKQIQEQFCKINEQINQMMNTTQSNLKLLAQFGTIDQQEIEMIQKKQQEEEQFLKKLQQQVSIQIVSTFKQKDGIHTFIVYIIQIQINTYRIRTYQRYSDLIELQTALLDRNFRTEQFQRNCINLISEDKLIQARQESIQDFLKSIFFNTQMKKYEDILIQHLDLPENFFAIDKDHNETLVTMRGSYTTQMRNTLFQEDEFEIVVFLPDDKSITLQITKHCKTIDLIDTVCRSIFLDRNFDFKLMILQNNTCRYLDDNEVVYKVMKNYNHKKRNFLSKLLNGIYYSFSSQQQPKFYLKKYLYLSYEIEFQEFNKNKRRSLLLFYQELSQLKFNHSNLSQKDYVIQSALAICILYNNQIHKIRTYEQVRMHWFQNFVPLLILNSVKKVDWRKQIFQQIKRILIELQEQQNQQECKNEIRILEIQFLNNLYKQKQHGIKMFTVKMMQNSFLKKQKRMPINITLGILHNEILIFELNQQVPLMQFPIQQLQQISIQNSVMVTTFLDGYITFKHQSIMEVYRLMEEYQQISLLKDKLGYPDTVETNDVSQIS
ncbi:unnamed protein product [Paramecium octaurelia]|uniref:DH domain-containing protein n=1 Tax=Paramecium octaurelia TaxID=43137 RepID=A0A8S1UJL5_PAROT|nr:unnamed protein product [Paramecium octaurelia]